MLLEEPSYDVDILFRFDCACAVDDTPTLLDQCGCMIQDGLLRDGHLSDIIDMPTPFDIRLLGQSSNAGSRCINENDVCQLVRCEFAGIALLGRHNGRS